jgi:hypothetical protein
VFDSAVGEEEGMKQRDGNKAADILGATDSSAQVRLVAFKDCSWDRCNSEVL